MSSLPALLPILLLVLVCTRLLVNWGKLSEAPGPPLAGCTDLWRAYQQYNGRLRQKLLDLHCQHGPIVRYGVRSVSISDPDVISVVYGSRAGFITADSYKVLVGIQNGKEVPSLVSTQDETRHGLVFRNPISMRQKRAPSSMAAAAVTKLKARASQPNGDTTATTATAVIVNLVKNPEFSQVSKLPYLNSVIKERGVAIAGMFFPEGTSIDCHRVEIYGEDANVYRPERWLTSNREKLRQMEAAHMGFSRGRRSCLGQNIAVMQMKKVIPALVMKFKFHLVDPEASLEADYSPAIACLKPLCQVAAKVLVKHDEAMDILSQRDILLDRHR
ncbi:cytochrome P450 [Jackrogersella minutella]|nr:cytochrome P450 [Jackrogersella minutella]